MHKLQTQINNRIDVILLNIEKRKNSHRTETFRNCKWKTFLSKMESLQRTQRNQVLNVRIWWSWTVFKTTHHWTIYILETVIATDTSTTCSLPDMRWPQKKKDAWIILFYVFYKIMYIFKEKSCKKWFSWMSAIRSSSQ